MTLKGKFSSGREGALASTLNHDFNWKRVGVAFYYDLKYNRKIQVLKDLSFPGCLICSIVSLLCKRPHESNVALTDVWFYLSNLNSVNRF